MKRIIRIVLGVLVIASAGLPKGATAAETFVLVFSGGPQAGFEWSQNDSDGSVPYCPWKRRIDQDRKFIRAR